MRDLHKGREGPEDSLQVHLTEGVGWPVPKDLPWGSLTSVKASSHMSWLKDISRGKAWEEGPGHGRCWLRT